jgi:hypothetical protein
MEELDSGLVCLVRRIWARGTASRLSGLHSGTREQLLQPLLGTNAARGAFLPHARQQADRDRMQAIWWKGGAQQLGLAAIIPARSWRASSKHPAFR